MSVKQYSVRELRAIVSESATEFTPKLGTNVEKDNKTINDKAYKDMEQATKSYDGGARNESSKKPRISYSDNRGMQDLEYDNINKDFKEKVKSQLKGYVSKDAENKHKKDPFGNAEFTEIDGMDEKNKTLRNGKHIAKEIGLTSREINKKDIEDQTHSVFENKKIARLKFKNTTFLTENHMLTKVPDDFKVDGRKFSMRDKHDNEYLVEWGETPKVSCITKINEQKNRIQELFNYKRGESNTSCASRLTEENKVTDMLNKTRQLMK